MTFIFLIN